MKTIKNTLLVLLLASQGCIANQVGLDSDDQKNDHELTVMIESGPQVSIKYTARPFDALDRFVKTLSRADFDLAMVSILFASGKILMFNNLPGIGYGKYLGLAFFTVRALGLAKVAQYLQYYTYLFVRGGLGYLAPRKIVSAVNERLVSYEERFPYVIDFAAILCSFSASVYLDYLKNKLAANPLYYISNF